MSTTFSPVSTLIVNGSREIIGIYCNRTGKISSVKGMGVIIPSVARHYPDGATSGL